MKDIIFEKYNLYNPEIKCLDKGFVRLIDCMPRVVPKEQNSSDYAVAEAARGSYNEVKAINDDRKLIRYLARKTHTSPYEQVEFKFHIKLPMYICTQFIRHRTASMNILSGRYSKFPNEFYIPNSNNLRSQDLINKQGSNNIENYVSADEILKIIEESNESSYNNYKCLIDKGIAREQARGVLPYDIYTEMYWKIDLHNLLHFLDLRCDSHSQWEIRKYANAILELISPIIPITIEAWEDYSPYREGLLLSRLEVEAIKKYIISNGIKKDITIETDSKSEKIEWEEKAKRLGFFSD